MRKVIFIALGLTALVPAPAKSQEIKGAGSSFAYPIIANWSREWSKQANKSAEAASAWIDYQSIGSGAGILRIKQRSVDFGASDVPLKSDELKKAGLAQFPIVIGGVVPVVNVAGVEAGAIKFTAELLAGIYLGKIDRWSDPAIKAVNPDVKLPDAPIGVIYRSDSSGTTFTWTSYLASSSSEWRQKIGVGKTVPWPTGTGFRGNEGVSIAIKNARNAIAYLEYSYVVQGKLAYALVQNQAGIFIKPEPRSFLAAAARADWRKAGDFHILLTDTSGDDIYPVTAATFILMQKRPASATRAQAALDFFRWSLDKGSKDAVNLGYTPLPADLVAQVKQYWSETFSLDVETAASSR